MRASHINSMSAIGRGEPADVVRFGHTIFAIAWLLIALVWFLKVGAITAVFMMGLGAAAGSLRKWQSERGLWMLAGLFLSFLLFTYGCWIVGGVFDWLRGAKPANLAIAVDAAFATVVMQTTIQFLFKVARQNYRLNKPSQAC